MESPERQSCKEDERCPDPVIPMRLVDICLHIIRICLQNYKNILYFCRQKHNNIKRNEEICPFLGYRGISLCLFR